MADRNDKGLTLLPSFLGVASYLAPKHTTLRANILISGRMADSSIDKSQNPQEISHRVAF